MHGSGSKSGEAMFVFAGLAPSCSLTLLPKQHVFFHHFTLDQDVLKH